MKDYNEIAREVLRRRDERLAAAAKKRAAAVKTASAVACFCIVAFSAVVAVKLDYINKSVVESVDSNFNTVDPENGDDPISAYISETVEPYDSSENSVNSVNSDIPFESNENSDHFTDTTRIPDTEPEERDPVTIAPPVVRPEPPQTENDPPESDSGSDSRDTGKPAETTKPKPPVTKPSDTTGRKPPVSDTEESSRPKPPATEPPETEPEGYAYDFKSDLSAYEPYMEPENRDEYLLLINTAHPLDETYKPTDLIDVADTRKDGRATQQLRKNASKSLEAMLIEARANGITDVTATSAYRSYDYQVTLFNQRVAMYANLPDDEAYAKAATIVAIPGTSEHQSGLCVDIHNNPYGADVSFENTDSGAWLAANSYKFGFILRFPKDKTEVTGISFEPWHFRYVGRYHASKMYELGYCLEEYFDYLGITDDLDYIDEGEEINERRILS